MEIDKYYKTKHWRGFRDTLLNNPDCVCELCGRSRWKVLVKGKNKGKLRLLTRFNVHHKHYRTLNKEKRDDVMVLCYSCHQLSHDILRRVDSSPYIQDLQRVVRGYFSYDKVSCKKRNCTALVEKRGVGRP